MNTGGALASGVLLFTIAKYSRENFRGTLKNRKSLSQRLPFPLRLLIRVIHAHIRDNRY